MMPPRRQPAPRPTASPTGRGTIPTRLPWGRRLKNETTPFPATRRRCFPDPCNGLLTGHLSLLGGRTHWLAPSARPVSALRIGNEGKFAMRRVDVVLVQKCPLNLAIPFATATIALHRKYRCVFYELDQSIVPQLSKPATPATYRFQGDRP